jgi:prophage regulatory protein
MSTNIRYIEYTGERLVRENERHHICGLSRAAWYRLEREGRAPRRFPIGERSVAWRLSELEKWVEIRARGEEWVG